MQYSNEPQNESLDRRRAMLAKGSPDDSEVRKLLPDDPGPMTLRESACYIAGYVAGFANASEEHVPHD